MKQDIDPSERSYSMSEMAELTHETQVEIFGWCRCEDNEGNENPYSDCPTGDSDRVEVAEELTTKYTMGVTQ